MATRVSRNSFSRECQTRVSHKSFHSESALQECRTTTKMFYKIVQECHIKSRMPKVSCHKCHTTSVLQDFLIRASYTEWLARVSGVSLTAPNKDCSIRAPKLSYQHFTKVSPQCLTTSIFGLTSPKSIIQNVSQKHVLEGFLTRVSSESFFLYNGSQECHMNSTTSGESDKKQFPTIGVFARVSYQECVLLLLRSLLPQHRSKMLQVCPTSLSYKSKHVGVRVRVLHLVPNIPTGLEHMILDRVQDCEDRKSVV